MYVTFSFFHCFMVITNLYCQLVNLKLGNMGRFVSSFTIDGPQ